MLILPALAHAFLGFLAELPAARTLGPNTRWELVEMNRDLSHLALFGRRKEKGSGSIIRCWDLKGKWVSAVILGSYRQQQPG